jgi:hypothetical protein
MFQKVPKPTHYAFEKRAHNSLKEWVVKMCFSLEDSMSFVLAMLSQYFRIECKQT